MFLDVRRDRYFRLAGTLGDVFIRLTADPATAALEPAAVVRLTALGVLIATAYPARLVPCAVDTPVRRVVLPNPGARLRDVVEILIDRSWIGSRLRCGSMESVLGSPASPALRADRPDRLAPYVGRFMAARRFVPLARNCLRDSLALKRFLARRGLGATLVIGVTTSPFGAHCWLQAGDSALNDELDRVRLFTPILAR